MLEKNQGLAKEQDRLEKGSYTGQTVVHWVKGVARLLDFPKRPVRRELGIEVSGIEEKVQSKEA
ncbi:MAG: hypothetical protein WC505_08280 [Patescibacteria group bacterium]